MTIIDINTLIQSLKDRRGGDPPSDSAKFQLTMTQLLAMGAPVSVQQLAAKTGFPHAEVEAAFDQMKTGSSEFNEDGHLVGMALTQIPTIHHVRVNGVELYAWCAVDTLFLPAYIGQPADIESTCPVTGDKITLRVTPSRVESLSPAETVVSIVVPSLSDTCNTREGFCGQIYFFSSRAVAEEWAAHRPEIAIFSVEDTYRIAHEVYIKPFLNKV